MLDCTDTAVNVDAARYSLDDDQVQAPHGALEVLRVCSQLVSLAAVAGSGLRRTRASHAVLYCEDTVSEVRYTRTLT